MNYSFRDVTENDAENVSKLLFQLWPDRVVETNETRATLKNMKASNIYTVFGAESESKLIGFCVMTITFNFWVQGKLANISTLVIEQEFRGKGIGKSFVERCIQIAKENECAKIELESGFHRTEAHKFYENIGFDKRAYFFSKDI